MSFEVVWPPRTRLRAGEAYVRCGDCKQTVIGQPGATRCEPCGQRYATRKRAMDNPIDLRRCKECGGKFPIDSGARVTFCSDKCARDHRIEQAMALARAAAEQLNIGESTGWRRKLYEHLAERDGGDCYLCGEHVRLSLAGERHMRGPSVDHVFPHSKGGSDDLDNLALTHLICNIRKGATILER